MRSSAVSSLSGGTPLGGTPLGGTPLGGTPLGGTPLGGTPLLRHQCGVTLLELLVALAVFAVIGAASYAGLGAVLDTRAALDAEAQRLRELQLALTIIERDVEQITPRPVRDEFGLLRAAVETGDDLQSLMHFTRGGWDNPLQLPRAGLQRLRYRLSDGQLWRDYWQVLDRGVNQAPLEQRLLDGVADVRLRFLDVGGVWLQRWPPPGSDPLVAKQRTPRAVELRIELRDWGEITRLLRLADVP